MKWLASKPARLTTGLFLSLACTLIAWWIVSVHENSGHFEISHTALYWGVVACALVQLFVQLGFFLHVGEDRRPRWNTWALGFAAIVVSIIVFGSIWIMDHLSYHMSGSPTDTDHAIMHDEGIGAP